MDAIFDQLAASRLESHVSSLEEYCVANALTRH
jgi:hypothetical protein